MFFLFPIGHDRSVFGLPRVTLAIIAACTLIFLVSWGVERSAIQAAEAAHLRALNLLDQSPEACVDFSIDGLPQATLDLLAAPQCPAGHALTQADTALIGASRETIASLNRIPTLRLGYRPGRPSIGTLFSSMWMHGGFFHLIGNMVFLLLAGSVIESFWGPARYVALYLVAGVVGTLLHHLMSADSLTPMVGASGAISGLLGAFVVLYPRTRVQMGYLLWLLIYIKRGSFMMPAWAAIPLWAAQQVMGALMGADDGVAYGAHVGGFVVGALAGIAAFVVGFGAAPSEEDNTPASPSFIPPSQRVSVPQPRVSHPEATRSVASRSIPAPARFPDGIPLEFDDQEHEHQDGPEGGTSRGASFGPPAASLSLEELSLDLGPLLPLRDPPLDDER